MTRTTDAMGLIYGLIFGAMASSFFVTLGEGPELFSQWIAGLDLALLLVLVAFPAPALWLPSTMGDKPSTARTEAEKFKG